MPSAAEHPSRGARNRAAAAKGTVGQKPPNRETNPHLSTDFRYTGLSSAAVNAVEFQGVSKSYAIYDSPGDRLKELLSLNRLKRHRDFWALHDLTFEVKRGETFCIVGENGSGKSTLLQMVAGILQPTSGTVAVNGRVSALLELGAGFNPGIQRARQRLPERLHPRPHHAADRPALPAISRAFAEIGDFIDQPVKTYSSGMVVRLAFAVAINVDPEILLVDEALAVGDIYFRQRCMRKVHELRARGITILFVSHAVGDVKAIGDRALWLDHGPRCVEVGEPDRVVSKYLAAMVREGFQLPASRGRHEQRPRAPAGPVRAPEIVETIPNIDHRYGDGRAESSASPCWTSRASRCTCSSPASRIVVRISVRAKERVPMPIVGFMLRNQLGMDFSGTNTAREGYALAAHAGRRRLSRWISTSTCRSSTRRRSPFRRRLPTAR